MKKNIEQGFTLIELMVVVAIIGILAAVALPAYQSYTVRAQIAESIVIVEELKANVSEYYKFKGFFPKDNKASGIPKPEFLQGNYVSKITLEDGAFHISLGNNVSLTVADKVLTIRPIVVTGSPASPFSWVCGGGTIPDAMEAKGMNKTTIPDQFLPAVCRL